MNYIEGQSLNPKKPYYDKIKSEYLMTLKFKTTYILNVCILQNGIVYKLLKFEENIIRINRNYLYG